MLKPILFNTETVRAILDGRKTATRRVIKFPRGTVGHLPDNGRRDHVWWPGGIKYPPYDPGDILWVRETWQFIPCTDCKHDVNGLCHDAPVTYENADSICDGCFVYRADYPEPGRVTWKPSIHMPKDAARIFLHVTEVRAERLQDMGERDADREGYIGCDEERTYYFPEGGAEMCTNLPGCPYSYWYCRHTVPEGFGKDLWDSTIKPKDRHLYGWGANPWVWVIEFERCEKPDEEVEFWMNEAKGC